MEKNVPIQTTDKFLALVVIGTTVAVGGVQAMVVQRSSGFSQPSTTLTGLARWAPLDRKVRCLNELMLYRPLCTLKKCHLKLFEQNVIWNFLILKISLIYNKNILHNFYRTIFSKLWLNIRMPKISHFCKRCNFIIFVLCLPLIDFMTILYVRKH